MPFRGLYEAILEVPENDLVQRLLEPWLAAHAAEVAWLPELGHATAASWPDATDEQLYTLYALSRVNDLFLLGFQDPPSDPAEWRGPRLSLDEYRWFTGAIGLSVVPPAPFHPFFDEIVTLAPAAHADAPIEVLERRWPGLRLGALLFSRAGCAVRAGADVAGAEVATRSTLYWASRRHHRPVSDLSMGWGSNSRWRTRFRRDYDLGDRLHYNVDGHRDPYGPVPELDRSLFGDLTGDERVELLVHRSFVRTAKRHDDLWPWDDTWVSERAAG